MEGVDISGGDQDIKTQVCCGCDRENGKFSIVYTHKVEEATDG